MDENFFMSDEIKAKVDETIKKLEAKIKMSLTYFGMKYRACF